VAGGTGPAADPAGLSGRRGRFARPPNDVTVIEVGERMLDSDADSLRGGPIPSETFRPR
jgi:hypothetical protein